jgi:serine-type D-Ala-D-Ala endopeptidase (penicillin-binding protein 7)
LLGFAEPIDWLSNDLGVFPVIRKKSLQLWCVLGFALSALALMPAQAAAKRTTVVVKSAKKASPSAKRLVRVRYAPPPVPSFGQRLGLHATDDPLDLRSASVLVLDQDTNEVLLAKNADAVLPIASITKLMTALVVADAQQPLDEALTINAEDIDTEKGSRSRLQLGTTLTRGEMLHLALMASENRAANALGRHFPGGLPAFVDAMNRKAQALGMRHTRYVEPTGLSSRNQSNAGDLALLMREAGKNEMIRRLSTSLEAEVAVGRRALHFRNTNSLVRNSEWEIGLQKTGYIAEAGRCVVMQAQLAGRKLIMVLLDSAGRYSRVGDAERIRHWLTHDTTAPLPAVVPHIGTADEADEHEDDAPAS